MRRICWTAALLAASISYASAADDGCDKFAWSLAKERAALNAAGKPTYPAGETLTATPPAGFTVSLKPDASATFVIPPERKPKAAHWFGGAIHFPAPDKGGLYQITLSDEAWIDIVQDGHYAREVGHSGRSDCPGLRKTLRVEVTASPFVLQLSGAPEATIAAVVGPVQ